MVSILLASSVIGTQSEEPSPWSVLVNVLFYFVSALVCGILGGLVIAWSVRQVHLEPHFQVLWILVIAYSVYVGTEAFLSTSSIFTIFVCALVCALEKCTGITAPLILKWHTPLVVIVGHNQHSTRSE